MVEVSHEALIRGWPLLQGWIDADREALRIQHRLSAAAQEWLEHERDLDYLYRGARLGQAEEWAEPRRDELSADEQGFLDASVELRDAEARRLEEQRRKELEHERKPAQEREKVAAQQTQLAEAQAESAAQQKELAQEQARSANRLRAVLGAIVVALIVTAGIAVYAFQQKQEADTQRDIAKAKTTETQEALGVAEKQRDIANTNVARFFATEAGGRNLARQPTLRLLLAAKAASVAETDKTDSALRKVLTEAVGSTMLLRFALVPKVPSGTRYRKLYFPGDRHTKPISLDHVPGWSSGTRPAGS